MNATFTAAAIDRIVQCFDHRANSREMTTMDVLSRIVHEIVHEARQGALPFNWQFDALRRNSFGDGEAMCVLAIAGLIELGLAAGYIDLVAWGHGRAILLRDLLTSFDETLVADQKPVDLTLFRSLLDRFERNDLRAATHNDRAFGGFESYLNLTSFVWADETFQEFLTATHRGPTKDLDLPFLLSPRHFAAAVATGQVGEVRTDEVDGGLSALRYFHWLADILHHVTDLPELRDGIVRHADWSHGAHTVRSRLDHWANQMSEWAERGHDARGEEEWHAYSQHVFRPLAEHQIRLGLREPRDHMRHVERKVEEESIERTPDQLLAEGRVGAAYKHVISDARMRDMLLTRHEANQQQWHAAAEELIQDCELLAALGDVDSAAAYLAPLLDQIYKGLGRESSAAKRAANIIKLSRTEAQKPGRAEGTTETAASPGTITSSREQHPAPPPKYRRMSEESSD
ncbi:MAG: hypothetical protein NTAFB01_06790 [Nitrospira sp.]